LVRRDSIIDVNLTGQVGLDLPWFSTIAGVFLGAILTGAFTLYRDYKRNKDQETQRKREAYGQLIGRGHMLLELYAAYYTALLEAQKSKYSLIILASLNKLEGMEQTMVEDRMKQSIEFTMSQEAKNRCEDIRLQLAKGIERFWTTITRIQISFPYMTDLNDKVSAIENAFKSLDKFEFLSNGFDKKIPKHADQFSKMNTGLSPDDVLEWGREEARELNSLINSDRDNLRTLLEDLKTQIDNLSIYLRPELAKKQTG
jgi:hypothetical protein